MTQDDLLELKLVVNGSRHVARVEARTSLADFLRQHLRLTGTHVGCEHGSCGACTVLVDGEPVRSCLLLAIQMSGKKVETVESLASGDHLHALQRAFVRHAALQCGFCTPGFLMESLALLRQSPRPSQGEVVAALSSNLCRCTGYGPIGVAVEECLGEIWNPAGATAIDTPLS